VDPWPSDRDLAFMYAHSDYHAVFYSELSSNSYNISARILLNFSAVGSTVLDYGCGVGHFLCAVKKLGYQGTGVELDEGAGDIAASGTGCLVLTPSDFFGKIVPLKFDVIHLGDVLEHLQDPEQALKQLLAHLKPGGLLFVEGPLETNPSPVYWASYIFGSIKKLLYPTFIGAGKPTHLFRTCGGQQRRFLQRIAPESDLLFWQIYETGWPYANGGLIKRVIAKLAILIGGVKIGSIVFGNRFRSVLRVN
jgi:SAM-dependent methyltransferase